MHVLPRVRELERRFPTQLVVIGVHAGKFRAERDTRRIRRACDRLGVTHPVVNDRHYRIWRAYAVNAWPSVALIDPDGYLLGVESGEFDESVMADLLVRMTSQRPGTTLRPEPFDVGPDPTPPRGPQGPLRYPARVLARGDTLLVSDAGNRRVVEVELRPHDTGRIVREFCGGAGVRFVEPQGLAVRGDDLYVADREGQSVWRIDLNRGECERVAGTGRLGTRALTEGPSETDLRSPWGLAARDGNLLVTMAGSHQIWELDPEARKLTPAAGSGIEEIADGRASSAALAQPTGIVTANDAAYFADCESSAVRALDMRDGVVRTVVGTGLFDFGDADGRGDDVRLQHCLDVAWWGDRLVVADTYNDKLKLLDPLRRRCEAFPGAAGRGDALAEPGGVFADGARILVADTGNHRVVRIADDGAVAEIRIRED